MGGVADPLLALRQALAGEGEVVLAVVFGSFAAGRATRRSDIDLGVLMAAGTARARLLDLAVRLERATSRTLDLVDLGSAPPQLRFEIARGGCVLLERRASAWADFKAAAMLDWWDWAPTARQMHAIAIARLAAGVPHGAR